MLALVGILFGVNVAEKIVSEQYGIYTKGQQCRECKDCKDQQSSTKQLLGQDGHDHFRDDFNLTEEQESQLCDGLKSLSDRRKTKFITHLNSVVTNQSSVKDAKSNSVVADVLNKASGDKQQTSNNK